MPTNREIVLAECAAEAERTDDNLPDPLEADYAADIVRHLTSVWGPF